ncbi:MAG: DNA primase [Cyclobacteriaceae bacterium]
MISQTTIDAVRNTMDIVEVVSDFVDLKKSGSSYKALSPFSSEKTPSFYVVPSKQIFKDFSSGKGGDAITFVKEIDGLSYIEAIKYLAQKYGIEIVEEERTDEQLESQNRLESLYIVMNFAAEYFTNLLRNHEEGQSIGLSYFRERSFSDETIENFRLGYSLNVWDHFLQEAKAKGYSQELVEEAGLVIAKEDGKVYDRFRGRVIFPIMNITGKVIAFGARILASEKQAKQPKYLNSPETELYNKSRVLYGMFQSKQSIRQQDNCYLVEGYTDVISLHQAGVTNVVSSSGTALTGDQAKLIRRYTQNVTILFDGDAAGLRASFRGIDILLESDLNVKAVPLPEGEDPDSYCKQLGTTAFEHYLTSKAQDFIQFKTSILLADVAHDPVRKAGVVHEIVDSIAIIGDSIKRSLYIKECANMLEISESVLIVELNKVLLDKSKKERQSQVVKPALHEEVPMPVEDEQIKTLDGEKVVQLQEKESIRLLINYGSSTVEVDGVQVAMVDYIRQESEEIEFLNPVYNRIIKVIMDRRDDGLFTDVKDLLEIDDEEMHAMVIELSASKYEISQFWKEKFDIIVDLEENFLKKSAMTNVLRLKFWLLQKFIETKAEELKSATEEKIDEILDEMTMMKEVQIDIAKILGNVTIK